MESTDANSELGAGLFRLEDGELILRGGRSTVSGLIHFPLQDVCPYTGAKGVEPIDLPSTGTLWSWTTVNASPPGYHGAVPYSLGIVEMNVDPGVLRVVGRIENSISPESSISLESPIPLEQGMDMTVGAANVALADDRDPSESEGPDGADPARRRNPPVGLTWAFFPRRVHRGNP